MIEEWLRTENYQATKVHELLTHHGYAGGYETVKRAVRQIKEQRDRIAYLWFETMPGQQAQVDFAEFQTVSATGQVQTVYVFLLVLGGIPDRCISSSSNGAP